MRQIPAIRPVYKNSAGGCRVVVATKVAMSIMQIGKRIDGRSAKGSNAIVRAGYKANSNRLVDPRVGEYGTAIRSSAASPRYMTLCEMPIVRAAIPAQRIKSGMEGTIQDGN